MSDIIPGSEKEEDQKEAKDATQEAGKVNTLSAVADAVDGIVKKPKKQPSADQQQAKKEKGWQSTLTSGAGGSSMISSASEIDVGGGSASMTGKKEAGINGNGPRPLKPGEGPTAIKNISGDATVSGDPSVLSTIAQAPVASQGPSNTVVTNLGGQNNPATALADVHGNSSVAGLNGKYSQNVAVNDAEQKANAEFDGVKQDLGDLQSDISAQRAKEFTEDAKRRYNLAGAQQESQKANADGSAYERAEPESSWGRNAIAIGSDIMNIANAAGGAVNQSIDWVDNLLKMTFQGGLHPGSIGHTIGRTFDATGKVMDDAVRTAGQNRGIDIDKLKQDKNAIGTFKGKQALQEEADIKNYGTMVRQSAGKAMAEAIGWKGGEMRPEHMEQALKNMSPEHLKAYESLLSKEMAANGTYKMYTDVMNRYGDWKMKNPGKKDSEFPISAKEKAVVGTYQQLLVPIKNAVKENDIRYKQRMADWKPYKQRAAQLKRDINEAERQGKTVAKERLEQFRTDYYNNLGDDKAIIDLLGGPNGDFTLNDIDEYGNLSMNAIYRAARNAEEVGITDIREKRANNVPLTPEEAKIYMGWERAQDYIAEGNKARADLRAERERQELEDFAATHSPLEVALKEARNIDLTDRSTYSDIVYGTTGAPKTRWLRKKVRDAANSTRSKLEQKKNSNKGLSNEENLMLNSAKNAIYVMDLQDQYDVYEDLLARRIPRVDPATADKIRDDLDALRKLHLHEIANHPIKDYRDAVQVNPADPRVNAFYEALDDVYKITPEAKEAARKARDAQEEFERSQKESERQTRIEQRRKDRKTKNKEAEKGRGQARHDKRKQRNMARHKKENRERQERAFRLADKEEKAYKKLMTKDENSRTPEEQALIKRVEKRREEDAAYEKLRSTIPEANWDAKERALARKVEGRRKYAMRKSDLYAKALGDPVVMNAFKKADVDTSSFAKEHISEEDKAESRRQTADAWAQAQKEMEEMQARQRRTAEERAAKRKAEEEARKKVEEPKKESEEPKKYPSISRIHRGGKPENVPIYREKPASKTGPLMADSDYRALDLIKDPSSREKAERALDIILGVEQSAGSGKYSPGDLKVIRDVVRLRGRVGDDALRRYSDIMTKNPDLRNYYTAYKDFHKYTNRHLSETKADPKAVKASETTEDGKQFTTRGVRGRNERLLGDKADMSDENKREATQLLLRMGIKAPLPSTYQEGSCKAIVDRMDKVLEGVHNRGVRDAVLDIRNGFVMDMALSHALISNKDNRFIGWMQKKMQDDADKGMSINPDFLDLFQTKKEEEKGESVSATHRNALNEEKSEGAGKAPKPGRKKKPKDAEEKADAQKPPEVQEPPVQTQEKTEDKMEVPTYEASEESEESEEFW